MMLYEDRPTNVADEAVAIVHRGLAPEVQWLRANGHYIPTWQERLSRRNLLAMQVYAYRCMDITQPTSFVKIGSVA